MLASRAPTAERTDLRVLDALRGLAALYVVLHHARWLLWQHPEGTSGVMRLVVRTNGAFLYGQQAVLLFFLISGFCIHLRQARDMAAANPPRFSIGDFAWRRFRRLYPPLLLAIGLTVVFDAWGSSINTPYYDGDTGYAMINQYMFGNVDMHSGVTLIGNLLMQSRLSVPAYGTNPALWSLAFEFWFYAAYPLLLFVSMRLGPWQMIGVAATASVIAVVVDPLYGGSAEWILQVAAMWAIWAAGALLAEAYAGRLAFPRLGAFVVPVLASVGGLMVDEFHSIPGVSEGWVVLGWGATLTILLGYLMLEAGPWLRSAASRAAGMLAPVGAISYSLYLVHTPILALVSAWWLSNHETLPSGLQAAVIGVTLSLIGGAACWYFVERHFVSAREGRTDRPAVPPRATSRLSAAEDPA